MTHPLPIPSVPIVPLVPTVPVVPVVLVVSSSRRLVALPSPCAS